MPPSAEERGPTATAWPAKSIDETRFRIRSLHDALGSGLFELPFCLRILCEAVLGREQWDKQVQAIRARQGGAIAFFPSRLILQDMLGLPLLLDVLLLREEIEKWGGRGEEIDLSLPVDLVIDHSMTVVSWANVDALAENQKREFELNKQRFAFFRACEQWFPSLRTIPPGGGIMHQVNLEFLATVVEKPLGSDEDTLLRADTVLGQTAIPR